MHGQRQRILSQRLQNQKKPEKVVQGTGFEPAKHYALGPKPSPFDHSGTPACIRRRAFESRMQRMSPSQTQGS